MTWGLGFHRRIAFDLKEILDHYESVAGTKLADHFYGELMSKVSSVQENPKFYPRCAQDIRRANLKRFPYNFLYEIRQASVWVFVLRHNKRNPNYGLRRR